MATVRKGLLDRAGAMCRRGAVALIAGVWRSRTIRDIDRMIAARPRRDRILITGCVLGALFALSVFAAQFGLIGMLVFWIVVIVIVN